MDFRVQFADIHGNLREGLTDQNPVQGTNFAPVPLYILLDGDKPDSWANVFHTRFAIDSFVTLNLYEGSKHIVFLVQDMYILNFPFYFSAIMPFLIKNINISTDRTYVPLVCIDFGSLIHKHIKAYQRQ